MKKTRLVNLNTVFAFVYVFVIETCKDIRYTEGGAVVKRSQLFHNDAAAQELYYDHVSRCNIYINYC